MVKEDLRDRMASEQRPEGEEENQEVCPSLNCSPNLGFPLPCSLQYGNLPLKEEDVDTQACSRGSSALFSVFQAH